MNSLDFYRELSGWDTEFFATEGVLKCTILIKNTESLNDPLVVKYKYKVGPKRIVAGQFLFTDLKLALASIQKQKAAEISDLEYKILQINAEIEKVHLKYANIYVEED